MRKTLSLKNAINASVSFPEQRNPLFSLILCSQSHNTLLHARNRNAFEGSLLSLRLHEPATLFKPEIAFLPSDAAGITVSHTAHALAGSPANIYDPIDPISMRLIELKLDGAHFPFCVKAHGYGDVNVNEYLGSVR